MVAVYPVSVRRFILAGGFAVVAAVAPAIGAYTLPAASTAVPIAACTAGEEEDVFTSVCTPFMVPNSPSGFTTPLGNPDIPEIDGIPCAGHNSGQCIGLAEDAEAEGPQPIPRSTISASP